MLKLKRNKSLGIDQIQAHMTQEGGKTLSSEIQEIMNFN
jgi:uncharacterized protein YneF (UPF0154 family)